MKILWLHSHFLYPTGGTRFIFEVATRLRKYHDITICVEKASGEWLSKYKAAQIPLRSISSHTSVNSLYWLLFPLYLHREINTLKKYINENDVVITSMFPMHYLASFFAKPVLYCCFEPFAFFYDKQLQNSLPFEKRLGSKLLSFMYQLIDKKGVSHAQKIITVNHSVNKWIEKIYHRKADGFSYLGVDTKHFYRRHILKPSKWQGRQIIFHSTDFTAMKGTHFLIKSLAHIVKAVPNVKLIISNTVFDENGMNYYKDLINNYNLERYIEFVGSVPYEDLPDYYSIADVACFTADPESIGTTASLFVLEAMACEVPVVRSVGCDEEVIHGESGYLSDPRNLGEYAKYVVKLLKQKKLQQHFGSNAQKRVSDFYQWDKVNEVFLKLLSSLE